MTTYTIFASTSDGYIQQVSTVYATARTGAGSPTAPNGTPAFFVGQNFNAGNYEIFESFVQFDTSVVGSTGTVTSAVLAINGQSSSAATTFTINAYDRDWGSALETADFVSGAAFGGLTLVASFPEASFSAGAYNSFASEAAFLSAINKTGDTRLILASSRHIAGSTPTGNEYVSWKSANQSGTSQDPKLTVIATYPTIGIANITEADDMVAATGTVAVTGTANITEADDTVQSAILTTSPGSINVRHAGAWQVLTLWVKHNGSWVQPVAGYVNQSGTWKRVL